MDTMRHEKFMKQQDEAGATYNSNMVDSPPHYQSHNAIECIDAIEAALGSHFEHMLTGNCIKYLFRFRNKSNPLQDLQKCRWYLNKLIEVYDDIP